MAIRSHIILRFLNVIILPYIPKLCILISCKKNIFSVFQNCVCVVKRSLAKYVLPSAANITSF